jgi:hypothetical protein
MAKCVLNYRSTSTDPQESKLFIRLEEEMGTRLAYHEYKKLISDDFVKYFGNWLMPVEEMEQDLLDRLTDEYEPKVQKDINGNLFFKGENNTPIYLNKARFPNLNPTQVKNITSNMLFRIMSSKEALDFEKIHSMRINLKEEIDKTIDYYRNNMPEDEDAEWYDNLINVIEESKEEFEKELILYLYNVGIKYNKKNSDQDSENEVSEANKNTDFNSTPSLYINLKQNASAEMKVLLSFLPRKDKVYLNKEGDYVIEDAPSDTVPGYVFEDMDVVWNTIQREFKDVTNYRDPATSSTSQEYTSVLEIFKTRLDSLSKFHPFLLGLKERLFGDSKGNKGMPLYKQLEFAQVFTKSMTQLLVTEVDPDTRTVKTINATDYASRRTKVLDTWSNNLERLLMADPVNKTLNQPFVTNLSGWKKELASEVARSGRVVASNSPSWESFKAKQGEKLIKLLKKVGIDISDVNEFEVETHKMLDYYTKYQTNDRSKILKAVELAEDLIYIFDDIKAVSTDKNSLYVEDAFESPINKRRSVKELAEVMSAFMYNSSEHTVLTANGKTIWTYSYVNYLAAKINDFKTNPNSLKQLMSDPNNKNSQWIKYLLALDKSAEAKYKNSDISEREYYSHVRRAELGVSTFGTMQSKDKSKVFDNTELKRKDAVLEDIQNTLNVVHNSNGVKHMPKYSTITGADKSTRYLMAIGFFHRVMMNQVEGQQLEVDKATVDIFYNYLQDEFNRMRVAYSQLPYKDDTDAEKKLKKSRLKIYYHTDSKGNIRKNGRLVGGAFKLHLFPSLSYANIHKLGIDSSEVYGTDGMPKSDINPAILEIVKNHIKATLTNSVYKAEHYLQAIEVISDRDKYTAKSSNEISKEIKDTFPTQLDMVANYQINRMISLIEYNKLFLGDPAYYKSETDIIKRNSGAYTDGLVPVLGITANDWVYNIVTIQDQMKDNTVYLERLRKYNKEVADPNHAIPEDVLNMWEGDTDVTDAQGWITPQRWFFLMQRVGKGNSQLDTIMEKINNNIDLNEKEISTVINSMRNKAQPLKGVYFNNSPNGPTYVKYSQMVLLPQFIKELDLELLYNKMVYGTSKPRKNSKQLKFQDAPGNKQQTHEVVVLSGMKVGSFIPADITTDNLRIDADKLNTNWNVQVLDNNYWKLQQDLPSKGIKPRVIGSQIQKVILNNLGYLLDNTDIDFTDVNDNSSKTVEEVYEEVHKTLGHLSDRGRKAFADRIGIDRGAGNIPNDKLKLVKSLLIRELKARDPLRNADTIEALEKDVDLNALMSQNNKLQQLLMSVVRSNAVRYESEGIGDIQGSSWGTFVNKEDIKSRGIYMLKDVNELAPPIPEVVDGKARIKPGQIFIAHSQIAKHIPNYRELSREELLEKIDSRMLEVIGYRIPTQGTSSADVFEIVGILPSEMGDTMIPYVEITKKTGSDFDIDKVFLMFPSIRPLYKKGETAIVSVMKQLDWKPSKLFNIFKEYIDIIGVQKEDLTEVNILSLTLNSLESLDKIEDAEVANFVNLVREELAKNNEFASKLEYIEFSKKTRLWKQDIGAIRNRAIELYKTILLSPNTIGQMIRPIDSEFLENNIKELFPAEESKDDLNFYTPKFQMDSRFNYLLGKAGVGITANNQVDHIYGQIANVLIPYIGSGYKEVITDPLGNSKRYTKLDERVPDVNLKRVITRKRPDGSEEHIPLYFPKPENSEDWYAGTMANYVERNYYEARPIIDVISAFLNAYVDIAKDPWIARGNHNTITAGIVFMLNRAGMDYRWVNTFIGQPVLRELVQMTLNNEGILQRVVTDGAGNALSVEKRLKNKYIAQSKELYGEEKTTEYLKQLEEGSPVFLHPYQDMLDSITGKNTDPIVQLAVLKSFGRYKKAAKYMKLQQSASKADVNGGGMDFIELLINKNRINDSIEAIPRFTNKFKTRQGTKTMLGHAVDNSIMWFSNILNNSNLLFTATSSGENLINIMSQFLTGKDLLDYDLGKMLEDGINTYIQYKFYGKDQDNSTVIDHLISRDNQLATTIEDLQKRYTEQYNSLSDEELLFMPLVNAITVKHTSQYSFLTIDMKKKGAELDANLRKAWLAMYYTPKEYKGEEPIYEGSKYRALATQMVRHVFFTSGFSMSNNHLYNYVPHEIMVDMGLSHYIKDYIQNNEEIINAVSIIDQIARHNLKNFKLVKKVKGKKLKAVKGYNEFQVVRMTRDDVLKTFKDDHIRPYITRDYYEDTPFGTRVTKLLYRAVGATKSDLYFVRTSQLGFRNKFGKILELTNEEYVSNSSIPANKLPNAITDKVNKFLSELDKNQIIPISEYMETLNNLNNSNMEEEFRGEEEELTLPENAYDMREQLDFEFNEAESFDLPEESPTFVEPPEDIKPMSINSLFNPSPIQKMEIYKFREKVKGNMTASMQGSSAEKHLPKELAKVDLATQFIGEGIGSTDKHRISWEDRANTGKYVINDVIMLAANGRRKGAFLPVQDNILQGEYKNIDLAIEAGADFVADTKEHLSKGSYNVGEKLLAEYLTSKGYNYTTTKGVGYWTSPLGSSKVEELVTNNEINEIDEFNKTCKS